jgi:hypothetical protein
MIMKALKIGNYRNFKALIILKSYQRYNIVNKKVHGKITNRKKI